MTCPVCGHQVPEGEYCGACGAHLPSGSVRRAGAYGADPGQHLLQPDIVSTLFPHLSHRRSTPFRLGLLLTAILLLVLGLLRLTGPGIAVAAASVPLLYVLYLYEVDLPEPYLLIGLTAGLGLLLGIPWALLTGPLVTQTLLHDVTAGPSPTNLVVEGVLLPLLAQALMLIGAATLFLRGRHRRPIDGFACGAAGALGFTLATTLVNLAPELQRGPLGSAPAVTNMLMIAGRGLLVPFLNASTTGLIAAALWLARQRTRSFPLSWAASLPAVVLVALAVRIVLGVIGILILRPGVVVTIYLIVAAALLLWMRVVLHTTLLAEVPDAAVGPALPCPHCRRLVPRMRFCPSCGIATDATPGGGAAPPAERAGRRGPRPLPWVSVAGTVIAGAVALGIVAAFIAPSRRPACGATCLPPPPPCLGTCSRAVPAPPLRTGQSYTSTAYGYSVDYTEFDPSQQDSSSIGWDLSSDVGQYSVEVTAAHAGGRSPQQIVESIVSDNFSGYSLVYQVPGAQVGYTPGAGAVYDDEVTPLFGQASHTRLVVLAAVKGGLAIAVVGDGDAEDPNGSQSDPSGLPVSPFVDSLVDGTRWPGEPPR